MGQTIPPEVLSNLAPPVAAPLQAGQVKDDHNKSKDQDHRDQNQLVATPQRGQLQSQPPGDTQSTHPTFSTINPLKILTEMKMIIIRRAFITGSVYTPRGQTQPTERESDSLSDI